MSVKPIENFDITGLPVAVTEKLNGTKRAMLINGTVYVSVYVWKLMDGATHDELVHLLRNLTVIDLSEFQSFKNVPPMYLRREDD